MHTHSELTELKVVFRVRKPKYTHSGAMKLLVVHGVRKPKWRDTYASWHALTNTKVAIGKFMPLDGLPAQPYQSYPS